MDMHNHGHDHEHGSAKAVHNMVLVGHHRIFLSHLPMFMAPHNAQVILEAAFKKGGKSVDGAYFADRTSHPTIRFYTLQPEPFALEELFQPDPAHPRRTQFKATVFRGHLEKGGTPIPQLQNIDVVVTRVVHASTFDGMKKLGSLSYVMFGDQKELFLAHRMSKAPDFDQILGIAATGQVPAAADLQRGVTIDVTGRLNQAKTRLHTNDAAAAQGRVTGTDHVLTLNISVQGEHYFEEGELSSATMSNGMFQQTREEKLAGFD